MQWIRSGNWKQLFDWEFLKDPLAICTAVLIGALIAILSNTFDRTKTLNLVWVVTTVLLIMSFGSAEKILVHAVLRIIGTVVGVGIGALLAFGHGEMVNEGASVTALYSYQIALQIVVVFLTATCVKLFPKLYDVFIVVALTIAILLFSPDLTYTKSRTLSVLLATGAALLCTLVFHYTMAEETLFREHRQAAENLMLLTRLAVSSEYTEKHEFDMSAHHIRASLRSIKTTWLAYVQWHRLTRREVPYDFAALSDSLRPLYYEVFSLYWSHTETNLRPRDARRLYCDTQGDFELLFRPLLRGILGGIATCAASLRSILNPKAVSFLERKEELEKLLSVMAIEFLLNLTLMNVRYTDNRLLCFSTRSQRWNMCEFMMTMSCVLMELVEYFQCIVALFSKEDADEYQRLTLKLTRLKEKLNGLRYETHCLVDVLPIMVRP
jgi:hypothetical protein